MYDEHERRGEVIGEGLGNRAQSAPFFGGSGDNDGGHLIAENSGLESITGVYTGNHAVDRSIPSAHDDFGVNNSIYAPTTAMGTAGYTHGIGCLEMTHITANDLKQLYNFDDNAEYFGVWDFCEEKGWAYAAKIDGTFKDKYVGRWVVTNKPTYWTTILWEDVDGDGNKDNRAYIYNHDTGQWDPKWTVDATVCTDEQQCPEDSDRPWHMWEGKNWDTGTGTCADVATTYGGNWKVASGGAWVQPNESEGEEVGIGDCFTGGAYTTVDLQDDYLKRWDTN